MKCSYYLLLKRVFLVICSCCLLQGCFPTTPLVVAGLGGHELIQKKDNIDARAEAALSVEEDLLTFSINAISRGRTEKAVAKYLATYNDAKTSVPIRALSLYQIGLMYMNIYNLDRNDSLAETYLLKLKSEFSIKLLNKRVDARLLILEERKRDVVILSPNQYLLRWKANPKRAPKVIPHDDEMNDMTARAITAGKIEEALYLYLAMYSNEGSETKIKSESLYQIGLIYSSPYNASADISEAEFYFEKIIAEFPNSIAAIKSKRQLMRLN